MIARLVLAPGVGLSGVLARRSAVGKADKEFFEDPEKEQVRIIKGVVQ